MNSSFRPSRIAPEPTGQLARVFLLAAMGSLVFTSASGAASPSVVTTIKPLHSIATAVMEGVGEPHILIDGAASPHGFALKPSQAYLLQGADVVFWVGPELTPALAKPIASMAGDATTVELMEVEGIQHLGLREGASFDAHDHADHENGEDSDNHEKHDDHDHEEHSRQNDHQSHASEQHEDHDGARDPHIWLNPENGIAIAGIMAETLSAVDPENAETYQKNAANFAQKIEGIEHEISVQLQPVSDKKFIVFHDAYRHFEHHFDVEASGAITLTPEALASADRVAQIQAKIQELHVACVFQEPQFNSKLVNVVLEGSSARVGTLDPLGTELPNGAGLYPALLKSQANSLSECLGEQ
jgi:zinc transport system substrate-binding protein